MLSYLRVFLLSIFFSGMYEIMDLGEKILGYYLMIVLFQCLPLMLQYAQSGVLVLLLRLAQEMFLESNEEVILTFDLLSRLVSSNMVIVLFQVLIACTNSVKRSNELMDICILVFCWEDLA